MGSHKALSLGYRFELAHNSLPHPCCLMGLLRPIIGLPIRYMDKLRHHLAMGDGIAAQLVSHIFLGSAPSLRSQRLKNRFAVVPSRLACR